MNRPLLACTLLTCLAAHAAEPPAPDATPATSAAPATAPAAGPAPTATEATETSTEDAEGPGPAVYMVTRVKLNGTDFTQVVFFRHRAITTLEACEAERNAGLTTGWNYFSRYYLKTLKGISYKVDDRCVEGKQQLSYWQRGQPLDKFYLIRTTDGRLDVQPYRNFFACRDALRAINTTETIDAFCGISSQSLREPTTP